MWHIGLENTLVRSEMLITYYCKVTAIKSKYWQIFIWTKRKNNDAGYCGLFPSASFSDTEPLH